MDSCPDFPSDTLAMDEVIDKLIERYEVTIQKPINGPWEAIIECPDVFYRKYKAQHESQTLAKFEAAYQLISDLEQDECYSWNDPNPTSQNPQQDQDQNGLRLLAQG